MKRNRINIRVADETWRRLQTEAHTHGSTMTAIIETALDQYFHPDQINARETLLLSRMDRFDARQGRIEADVRLCTETVGQYVLYWLTLMEPIPESERDAAHALGRRRYEHFIEQVAMRLNGRGGVRTQQGLDGTGPEHDE
ncbi:MAG: hypothetical protein GC152_06655 [Alphaproteobacteria bacterium]|nr:hypothetical protein [Alphaproteobacteria bacterium]